MDSDRYMIRAISEAYRKKHLTNNLWNIKKIFLDEVSMLSFTV